MENERQREYYRLTYPQSYRPKLIIDIDEYPVEDISECGIKFLTETDEEFELEESLMGILEFPDDKHYEISGKIIRLGGDFACLELDTPLPLSLIRSETLYIMYHYPSQQPA